ncbi:unnamed protein product [Onchocerca flexuosa]|uniref:Tudor domain-containing protein n=1 Tax=Onchocerca flexuosa TaxID=387005 RepID=A0A183HY77_9BILA|nr:unnamed protein product [Onchocerca flexuosa]
MCSYGLCAVVTHMEKVRTTQYTIQNWIAENNACKKALWLRRDGFSVCLMAKTKEPPVSLLLPLDSCFDVRILRIDYTNGFVFVRPLAEDDRYQELQQKLTKHSLTEHVRAENLNEDSIYLASNNGEVFRGTLIGQPSAISLLYGIDVGDMKFIDAQNIYQLPTDLQSIPPLCFCGLLPNCTTSLEYEDLSLINENNICLCKIYKILPPHFSNYPTVMYPPVVFIQLYKFTGFHNKYVEVIFKHKSRTIINNNEYFGSQCVVSSDSLVTKKRNDQNIEKTINVFQRTSQSYDEFGKADENDTCNEIECFTFKPYNIKLPSQVRAIVTAEIRQNVYWMRDADILSILFENLVDPGKHSKYESVNLVECHDEICCLVRLTKPFKECSSYVRFPVYRAVVTDFHDKTGTCLAYLVDFGLSVVCSTENLYSCKEQPVVIRETISAAFRCHVSQVLQQGSNERKTPKVRPLSVSHFKSNFQKFQKEKDRTNLYQYQDNILTTCAGRICIHFQLLREELYTLQLSCLHNNFYVCDIMSVMQCLKQESESESIDNDIRNGNFKNLTSESTSIEASSSKAVSSERCNVEQNNQRWFQSQPNNLYRGNKSARNEVTLTSIQLDVLKISEKIDNITNAKLASIHMVSYGFSTFGRLSNGLGVSKSNYNLHERKDNHNCWFNIKTGGLMTFTNSILKDRNRNATHMVRNLNDCWKCRSHRIMENGQLPLKLSHYVQPKHMIPSIIPVAVPIAVPLQCPSNCEIFNKRRDGCTQYQHDKHGCGQLNGNKLKIKRTNFHEEMRRKKLKNNIRVLKKWQRDKHYEDRPLSNKKILRTFYVRRLRNREGKLLYTSDESSTDESPLGDAQCQFLINDDDAAVENKIDVASDLLEKELVLNIDEPFVQSRKYAPAYQAFFEHVKVNEGDEVLVKRSDDDHNNKNWPLFFVQIQRDDLLDVLEELDSLQPTISISEEELQVGTLCLSFCHTFESMFRAVITKISNTGIEVYYVDYGNYETVNRNDLKSISNLPDIACTYPGMAIPCMLFNSCVAATLPNYVEAEDGIVTKLKSAVSCDHHSFRIRILKIHEDGVCIVKYISS